MSSLCHFFWLYRNYCVNKVALKIQSLCVSVNPAGWQRGLAHHMPNSPLAPCKYHKMSTGLSACVCARPSSDPSTRLFAPLFIICLSSFFPSFLSVLCLSSPPRFPNVKWQQRGRQRGRRTFLMEGFYILTSLPSLFLHLAHWGEKTRRQTEEKNINKLHTNWSAAGVNPIATPTFPACLGFKAPKS